MKPEAFFNGRPIRSLQTMLRVIGEQREQDITLVPDGIYGKQTMDAVSRFQRSAGIPVTGTADLSTWEAIVEEYDEALIYVSEAQPVDVVLNANQVIRRGESHPHVYLLQSMLIVISQAFGSVPAPSVTGVMDIATSESLGAFQALSGLPVTGELDKKTWKVLALQYPVAVNLLTL